MSKSRLEAFSDGVLAIIITIMVLDLRAPSRAEWDVFVPIVPAFFSYVMSFVFVGIYWNNHHHLLQAVHHVNGAVLWANLHLLFWLSLIPFVTSWMGNTNFAPLAMAAYGVVLLLAGFAFWILVRALIRHEGHDSHLARAIGRDRKGNASLLIYAASIPMSFVSSWIAGLGYVAVAVMWLIPDRRIEKVLPQHDHPAPHP